MKFPSETLHIYRITRGIVSSFAQKKCKCLTHTHAQTHTPACGGTVPATLLVNESSPYPPVQAPLDPPAQNLKT